VLFISYSFHEIDGCERALLKVAEELRLTFVSRERYQFSALIPVSHS